MVGVKGIEGLRRENRMDKPEMSNRIAIVVFLQGLIDASEDRFKKATHFGQGLITSSHFASEEVKEKVGSRVVPWPAPTDWQLEHIIAVMHVAWYSLCVLVRSWWVW